MYSKVKVAGHPLHPMLVAFPITFYTLTFVAFVVYEFVSQDPFWYRLAFFANMAGIGTALLAALPGFIDWAFGIPKGTEAKSRGFLHMSLNVGALLLFAINAFRIRGTWDAPEPGVMDSILLSLFGVIATSIAGFHGWEMIARHKVGVELTPQQERFEHLREEGKTEIGLGGRPRPV